VLTVDRPRQDAGHTLRRPHPRSGGAAAGRRRPSPPASPTRSA